MFFVFGIVANAAFFTPYIIFISILVFYVWKFWQSVEDKYFSLKLLIYEEWKNKENKVENGGEKSGSLESVVDDRQSSPNIGEINKANILFSRELYDFIRERLLPYQCDFFFFFVKCTFLAVFAAYGVFAWIRFLEASNATATVHALRHWVLAVCHTY